MTGSDRQQVIDDLFDLLKPQMWDIFTHKGLTEANAGQIQEMVQKHGPAPDRELDFDAWLRVVIAERVDATDNTKERHDETE